jgi:hypothetical protein
MEKLAAEFVSTAGTFTVSVIVCPLSTDLKT